jgi:hypothetical protein
MVLNNGDHPKRERWSRRGLAEEQLQQSRVRRGWPYVELCAPAAPSLFDDPPPLRTEWHFIKKIFVVVAASFLGSRSRLYQRVLSMRLLFVPHWGGSHLTC